MFQLALPPKQSFYRLSRPVPLPVRPNLAERKAVEEKIPFSSHTNRVRGRLSNNFWFWANYCHHLFTQVATYLHKGT